MILDPDYARAYTQIRIIAWQYGYCASLHGSYTRDLDVLLVPWEERAGGNHEQLIRLIAAACNLTIPVKSVAGELNWNYKPHGRIAISLHFPGAADRRWVDISIMPTLRETK